jgi:hypothetical protein
MYWTSPIPSSGAAMTAAVGLGFYKDFSEMEKSQRKKVDAWMKNEQIFATVGKAGF